MLWGLEPELEIGLYPDHPPARSGTLPFPIVHRNEDGRPDDQRMIGFQLVKGSGGFGTIVFEDGSIAQRVHTLAQDPSIDRLFQKDPEVEVEAEDFSHLV